MGRIYQRIEGGTYYGYWTDVRGRPRRKSLRTRDASVARQRLRQLELVSTDRATFARHPLHQAIADLLAVVETGNSAATWRSYRQKGERLIDTLGDIDCADLTRDHVLAYVKARRAAPVSDSTIHKELVVLRRALKEAKERGAWRGDVGAIVPRIKINYHPRERWLTPEQMEQLIAEVQPHRKLWVAIAGLAGGSLSEVEKATVGHVDLEAGQLRLPGEKRSTRWRLVPLHPTLVTMLEAAIDGRSLTDPLVLHWGSVRRDLHAAVNRINARNEIKRRRTKQPPLPKVSPNDLRRTFASWMKQRKVDSLTVAHLMGHSSTRMVELVYGRLSEQTYRDAVDAMPRLRSRRSTAPTLPAGRRQTRRKVSSR